MSAFGIFAAILTFVYVIYYAVMISMDLFGSKSQQKENVEVIASLDGKPNEEEIVDETPTYVDEEGGIDTAQAAQSTESPESPADDINEDAGNQEASKEDIVSADNNELYNEAKAAKDKAADLDIHSDADMNADQFDEWYKSELLDKEAATGSFS